MILSTVSCYEITEEKRKSLCHSLISVLFVVEHRNFQHMCVFQCSHWFCSQCSPSWLIIGGSFDAVNLVQEGQAGVKSCGPSRSPRAHLSVRHYGQPWLQFAQKFIRV